MSIFKSKSIGKENRRVVFLLTGWGSKIWNYWLVAEILEMKDFNCITYECSYNDLSPDTEQTIERLTVVRDDILNKIVHLKELGHSDFSIFGTSLGSMLALMVANKSKDVSKIILNTTGSDLAETVWSWDKVKIGFKEELLKQDFSLERLKKTWAELSPINNIDNLKDKKILVYLSKRDEIIPPKLGKELVDALEKKNCDFKLIVNNYLGHTLAGIVNLLKVNTYLKFLKS